jgi:hypothetical protein
VDDNFHMFVSGRTFYADQGAQELMSGAQIAELVGVPAARGVVWLDARIDVNDLEITINRTNLAMGVDSIRGTSC